MLTNQEKILASYTNKLTATNTEISTIQKQIGKFSQIRIGLFLAEILLLVLLLGIDNSDFRSSIPYAMIFLVFIFAYIVRKQSVLDKVLSYQQQLLRIYQNELNILNGLENEYSNGEVFKSEEHPYTSDLDIFGKASLFLMLNRCRTKNGIELLARTLSTKTTRENILLRQEAIKEVQENIDQTFVFRANLLGYNTDKIELIKMQLSGQLKSQIQFVKNAYLRAYVAIVPFVTLSLLLASIFISAVFWKIFVFVLIVHTLWNVLLDPKINKVFYAFSGGSGLLNGCASAIKWTENQNWKSAYILGLFDSKVPVSKEINGLSKIIQNFDARLNMLIGGILNGLLLWDLRCCISLDKWHTSCSKEVVSALNHLGDFEELISIATLSNNEADWVFPEIESAFALKTQNIGHPLIRKQNRVSNDFELKRYPTVDIVTGSNMAGKSTFLRTLGINMVLAYAAAPVCAKNMNLSIFALNTYMRIIDSLNESTSTFKAELNRLKMILDNVVEDRDTFVLIDEMLRGTNSRDKYLGSKVFIEKLIAEKTPAVFATHDLLLADLIDSHKTEVRNFHFDIQITEGEMNFDYKLKQGPCKTFNAAILLKEIGLSLD